MPHVPGRFADLFLLFQQIGIFLPHVGLQRALVNEGRSDAPAGHAESGGQVGNSDGVFQLVSIEKIGGQSADERVAGACIVDGEEGFRRQMELIGGGPHIASVFPQGDDDGGYSQVEEMLRLFLKGGFLRTDFIDLVQVRNQNINICQNIRPDKMTGRGLEDCFGAVGLCRPAGGQHGLVGEFRLYETVPGVFKQAVVFLNVIRRQALVGPGQDRDDGLPILLDENVKVVKASVGSWTEPAKMKELCLTQARDQNADVFYQVAGGSGTGLFEACVETGNWAIGVDSDQYAYYKDSENPELADVILTSMLKNVGDSLVAFFEQVEAGDDVWGKVNHLGLKDNAVGYVDNEFFQENVPQEVRDKMAESKEKIASGELEVQSYYDFADESEYQALLDSVAP